MSNPEAPDLLAQAKERFDAGAFDEAANLASQAAEADPSSAAAHSLYAAALVKCGRADQACMIYRLAIRAEPGNARHHLDLAVALHAAGRDAEARAKAEQAYRISPDLPALDSSIKDLSAAPGATMDWPPRRVIEPPEPPVNNSGEGPFAEVPQQVVGWNWAAFLLTWVWALGMRVYGAAALVPVAALIVLLCIALASGTNEPLLGVVAAFCAGALKLIYVGTMVWLGVYGNSMAWRTRKFESVRQFYAVQRAWLVGAVVAWAVLLVVALIVVASLMNAARGFLQDLNSPGRWQ